MIIGHRTQSLAAVFLKKNGKENTPTTIKDLSIHLKELLDSQLAELMQFGSTMRGTRPFWKKMLHRPYRYDQPTWTTHPVLYIKFYKYETTKFTNITKGQHKYRYAKK